MESRTGEVVSDGRNVVIGAPLIRASATYPPPEPREQTLAGTLANLVRHLKGVLASVEDLRILVEKQERK